MTVCRQGEGSASAVDDRVVRLQILETSVELRCASQPDADMLASDWARCLVPSYRAAGVGVQLDLEAEAEARGRPLDLGHRLTTRLTSLAVRDLTGRTLVFHACGLANDDGDVLALVGASGTGKTTAAASLAAERFGYVTDEAVAVSPRGDVVPFPKPLSVVSESSPKKQQHGPEALGLRSCPEQLRLRRVVVLERCKEAQSPGIEKLGLLEGILALAPHIPALAEMPRPLSTLSRLLDDVGGVHRLVYSDITGTAPLLEEVLAARPLGLDEWTVPDEPRGDCTDKVWLMWDGRVRRAPWVDAVEAGDEALVLVDRTPVRLGGIGLTIWREARANPTAAELLERVVKVHGGHPDARELVRTAIEDMAEAGVVGFGLPQPAYVVWAGLSEGRASAVDEMSAAGPACSG